MANRFICKFLFEAFKRLVLVVFLLSLWPLQQAAAQCNNIEAISFTPLDTVQCGYPATVNFLSNVSLDSTPVFLATAASTPNFQSAFSHNFSTGNNGCYYYLEISGMFTVWSNTPGYYDAYGFFNVNSNQFISQGVISDFFHTPPLFINPNGYNPNHVYRYYYLGNGSTINIGFSDSGQYNDNSGSMTFNWYAVPCFDYLWDFGDNTSSSETDPSHTYANPGTYQVTLTVTDLYNNCSDSFSSTITINPTPVVDLGADETICNNETLTLNATTPNATYQWQNGSNNPTFIASQSGLYWVDVTVLGCTSRDSIEVIVLDNIVNDISATICGGETITVGNNTYNTSGFYTTTLTTSEGCDSIVNLNLNVIAIDAVINSPLALDCNNSIILLDGNGSSTGSGFTYLWLTQGGNILNGANSLNPEINGAGLYQLIVTYDDGTIVCAATDTVTVFENYNTPIADAGPDQTLNCWTNSLTLDGSNSSSGVELSYQWSTVGGNIVSGSNSLNPLIDQSGSYTLVVTNEDSGCTASDVVTINESSISIDDFNVSFETPSCFGDDGMIAIQTISGNGFYLYSIDGGDTYYSDPVFNFLSSGSYTISIKDTFDCEVSQAFFLPVPVTLDVQLEPDITIQFGQTYSLNAEVNIPVDSIAFISWEPATGLSCDQCLDPVASPVETTEYTVTIVDNNGCQAQARVTINVKSSKKVYIPNAFSPLNRDGNNDVFRIYTSDESVKQVISFRIFNRWGSLVYEANSFQVNDPNIGWDGSFKGEMLQSGVFIYYIEIEFVDGKVVNYKGDVSILN